MRIHNITTRNNVIEFLKNFFEFLKDKTPLKITVDELQSLKGKQNKENTRSGIPLSFEEIIKLRKILRNEEKYEWLLTFELIYNFGLKYSQLTSVSNSSYDPDKGVIEIKGESFNVTSFIKYLIEDEGALSSKKLTKHMCEYRISCIAERINKDLIWKDIIKTRETNFLKCPTCGGRFENNPDNWAIYHYKIDDTKWILCRSCARRKLQ